MGKTAFVIHWQKDGAQALAETIRGCGWQVTGTESEDGGRAYKLIKANPPDVIVISLANKPSHGRQTAVSLQQIKATKAIPVVFVDGSETAVAQCQAKLPDATYTTTENLGVVLA